MVTEEKMINTVMLRYRLGTVLLWLGIFTWVPFIFLRAIGDQPPFLYFLPFHLVGVIGGSRLRSSARQALDLVPPRKRLLGLAGHALIITGILVWVPYLYSKLALGQAVEVMSYLPFHLAGVLGGVTLHVLSYLQGKLLAEQKG
jgi:hypothetical protein